MKKLKEDAKHYYAKPFPIPKFYEPTLKKEVNRLIRIGVLKKINIFQWTSPFIILTFTSVHSCSIS